MGEGAWVMSAIDWLEPWQPVTDGDPLVAELHRELCPRHVLYGRRVVALGRRCGTDDVLFRVLDGPQPLCSRTSDVAERPRAGAGVSVDDVLRRSLPLERTDGGGPCPLVSLSHFIGEWTAEPGKPRILIRC